MTAFDWYVVIVAIAGIPLCVYNCYLNDWKLFEEEEEE